MNVRRGDRNVTARVDPGARQPQPPTRGIARRHAGSVNGTVGQASAGPAARRRPPQRQNGMTFDTVCELWLVTQMLVPSNATPRGAEPTEMVAVTVLVAGLIFDTLFEL
jgi:hypothetical protein